MNRRLYEMLRDIECDGQGNPSIEVIQSARHIAGNDLDMQKDFDEIEDKIICDEEED